MVAIFRGSVGEFKRYVGPRLRNIVQQITRNHKARVGNCEHCGADGELHAAHVTGKDRIDIIESLLLGRTAHASQEVEVDLSDFERDFKSEHLPVSKAILVLCGTCHQTYDGTSQRPDIPHSSTSSPGPRADSPMPHPENLLPITLDPPRMTDFVDQLLRTKTAEIQTYFADGRLAHQTWHAHRLTRASNLFGNLRSRPDFRQGMWQGLGITKVHVRVVER